MLLLVVGAISVNKTFFNLFRVKKYTFFIDIDSIVVCVILASFFKRGRIQKKNLFAVYLLFLTWNYKGGNPTKIGGFIDGVRYRVYIKLKGDK